MGRTARASRTRDRLADHPHGRGENTPKAQPKPVVPGPSPRAWGEPNRAQGATSTPRTIPTGVGRTSAQARPRLSGSDHPHGRGENPSAMSGARARSGPSPRAWGELRGDSLQRGICRTIPTGVGRTFSVRQGRRTTTDHPHGRGENLATCSWKTHHSGPSPRAWGELSRPHRRAAVRRTIPTGVGRTEKGEGVETSETDHPHGRGENVNAVTTLHPGYGPSPRAWGERSHCLTHYRRRRTIPTGVGRTGRGSLQRRDQPDHPHGRGENPTSKSSAEDEDGPSPRAWGEPAKVRFLSCEPRTIPTGVGRTARKAARFSIRTDHPHGRGENTFRDEAARQTVGPSPRAWGERIRQRSPRFSHRTIPTGVGRTQEKCLGRTAISDHPHGRGENTSTSTGFNGRFGPSPRAWGEREPATGHQSPPRTIPTGVGRTSG